MDLRSPSVVVRGIFSGVLLWSSALAAAPINLAASRLQPGITLENHVVIPPTVVQTPEATKIVTLSGEVVCLLPACRTLIPVCTTFPGTVSLDGAGSVYKQPVEIDAQGHERAVGAPVLLASQKQLGGVITISP